MSKEIKLITKAIQKTAHLFELGNPVALKAWIIAHGYAMRADQILNKFDRLDLENNYFIAPEALSCFYWKKDGVEEPVASWMTSRFRLDEIDDYSIYLNDVIGSLNNKANHNLFGFSQGGTTMWRFINNCKPDFKYFINWSGDIPLDTQYDLNYLNNKNLYYIYGSKDQYFSSDRIMVLKERVLQLGLKVDFVKFEGGHRIDRTFLNDLFKEL